MDLTGLTFRIPLIQGRRGSLIDKYTGQKVDGIARGNAVALQHAIFLGDPKVETLAGLGQITSVTMVMRKTGPTGDLLVQKTVGILDFADVGMTYEEWNTDSGYQFAFALTAEETNQAIPGGATELAIYFAWEATLDSGDPVFLGSLATRIFEEGIGSAGSPTPGDVTYMTGAQTTAAIAAAVDEAIEDEATAREAADTTLTTAAAAAHAAQIAGQGIEFDGSTGIYPVGPFAAPGTGDFTLAAWMKVDSFVDSRPAAICGNIDYAPGLAFAVSFADHRVYLSHISVATIVGGVVADPFSMHFYSVSRIGGGVQFYVDGQPCGAPVADTVNITSPITILGGIYAAFADGILDGQQALFTYLNRGMDAAESLAFYNRGGILDPIDRGGSMTSIITGAASNFSSDSGFWTKESSATISGGAANFVGTDSRLRRNNILTPGRRYRLTFTISAFVSGSPYVIDGSGTPLGTITASNGTKTIEFTTAKYTNAEHLLIGNFVGSIDDLTLIPLGALVAIDRADRHAGYQIADVSGNARHLNLPASGVSIVSPARRGQVIYKATTSGWQQAGYIDPAAIIESIMARTQGDTTEIAVGNANGSANIVDAILSSDTDWRAEELLVRQSSTGQLWVYNDEVFPTDFVINFVLP